MIFIWLFYSDIVFALIIFVSFTFYCHTCTHTLSATHIHRIFAFIDTLIYYLLFLAIALFALCVPSCLVIHAQCYLKPTMHNIQTRDLLRTAAHKHTTQTYYLLVLEKYRQHEDWGWGWRGEAGRANNQYSLHNPIAMIPILHLDFKKSSCQKLQMDRTHWEMFVPRNRRLPRTNLVSDRYNIDL